MIGRRRHDAVLPRGQAVDKLSGATEGEFTTNHHFIGGLLQARYIRFRDRSLFHLPYNMSRSTCFSRQSRSSTAGNESMAANGTPGSRTLCEWTSNSVFEAGEFFIKTTCKTAGP